MNHEASAGVDEISSRFGQPAYLFVTLRLPLGQIPEIGTRVQVSWYTADPPPKEETP